VSGNGDKASASELSVTNYAKRQKKMKGKCGKKSKDDSKDIYNYCKEPDHWKRDYPKKANKDVVVALFRMTPHGEAIWF